MVVLQIVDVRSTRLIVVEISSHSRICTIVYQQYGTSDIHYREVNSITFCCWHHRPLLFVFSCSISIISVSIGCDIKSLCLNGGFGIPIWIFNASGPREIEYRRWIILHCRNRYFASCGGCDCETRAQTVVTFKGRSDTCLAIEVHGDTAANMRPLYVMQIAAGISYRAYVRYTRLIMQAIVAGSVWHDIGIVINHFLNLCDLTCGNSRIIGRLARSRQTTYISGALVVGLQQVHIQSKGPVGRCGAENSIV